MNRFDRYIFFHLLGGLLFLLILLIVFFILLHYVEYVDDFYDLGASMRDVFLVYYPSYIPEIIKLVSPLALFLSCIYITGRLAQEWQIIALMNAGVSLYRLSIPYLTAGLLVTGIMFWLNGWVVPRTNKTRIQFEMQYLKDAPRTLDTSTLHRQLQPGSLLSIGYFDTERKVGYRVSLLDFPDFRTITHRMDAARMQWVDSLHQWRFYEVVERTFTGDTTEHLKRYASLDTTLSLFPRDLIRTERDMELLTLPEARQHLDMLKRTGAGAIARQEVAYVDKYAYPMANLILIFIGLPLSAIRRRGGQAVQIALGLGLAFGYLALDKLTEPLGYTGILPATLAAWLPHICFAGLGLWLLWRALR